MKAVSMGAALGTKGSVAVHIAGTSAASPGVCPRASLTPQLSRGGTAEPGRREGDFGGNPLEWRGIGKFFRAVTRNGVTTSLTSAQVPDPLVLAVRTDGDPHEALEPVQQEIRGAGNDQVLYQIRTLEGLAGNSLAIQRFLLILFGILSALTLFLAAIGIYGVLAYLTGQRLPEFGLRIALGASTGRVITSVLRQSCLMVSAGVALGIAGAAGASRVLVKLVEGMQPADPGTFVAMIATLLAAALLASFLPAYRASRVDPIQALRDN